MRGDITETTPSQCPCCGMHFEKKAALVDDPDIPSSQKKHEVGACLYCGALIYLNPVRLLNLEDFLCYGQEDCMGLLMTVQQSAIIRGQTVVPVIMAHEDPKEDEPW